MQDETPKTTCDPKDPEEETGDGKDETEKE